MGGKRASLPFSNTGVNSTASHGVHGSRAVMEAFSEHFTAVYGWHPWAVERALLSLSSAEVNSTASQVVHGSRAVDKAYSTVNWGVGRAWCWYSQGSG